MAKDDVHVVPAVEDAALAHHDEPTCWCQPDMNYEDAASGARVWVHRRNMDGPVYENDTDG